MSRSVLGLRITDLQITGRARRHLLAGLALITAGLLALASVSGAGAEGPVVSLSPHTPAGQQAQQAELGSGGAVFLGFVQRTPDGLLATRVRAVGSMRGEAVNCGTASVTALDSDFGFFQVTVFSSATRAGCPSGGQPVQFRLLYGAIDPGIPATANQDLTMRPGETIVAILVPDMLASATRELWHGPAPVTTASGIREAALTWLGTDNTPIEEALAALDASGATLGMSAGAVVRAWRWDATSGQPLVYAPEGPSFLQTLTTLRHGDLVRFRFE